MLPLADDALPDRHADLRQRVRVDTTPLDWEAAPAARSGASRCTGSAASTAR